MGERARTTRRGKRAKPASAGRRSSAEKKGATAGALMATVAVGPLGAPIGAAAGAAVGAAMPDPDAPPAHTHDPDAPCYDGCPAWTSAKNA